ncbi:MAG: hypothetical protein ABFD64_05710 [Armatimonadota bacterium]
MPEISAGPAQSDLRIQSVELEPIGSGKNVVQVSVSNPMPKQKIFFVDIRTDGYIAWERQYTATVNAGETRQVRCAFSFIGEIAENSSVTLRFYEPVSAESCDYGQYFQQQLFSLSDLRLKTPVKLNILPESDIRAVEVRRVFMSFQKLIREGHYREIWDTVFSEDYRNAGMQSPDIFEKALTGDIPTSLLYWDRDVLLGMHPASVSSSGNLTVLSVTNDEETWLIDFIPSESDWHIDWISGFEPAILHIPDSSDWLRLVLAKTLTFNTQHFEVHYYKNSTAERELDSLAQAREQGYTQIVEFLGIPGLSDDCKILLFLFEDMKTKLLDTGYIGHGFAEGRIIGEIYNKESRLDPYHETIHILMSPYGEPPAILNEGIAVYMSELFGGTSVLHHFLGGRDQPLYARVRDLKQKGDWISLKELLTYPEIGPEESRPMISYVEAGAFVKFLIETFGKDKFLDAFKKLANPKDPQIHRQNKEELERVYGCTLQKLESDWERSFMPNDPSNKQNIIIL